MRMILYACGRIRGGSVLFRPRYADGMRRVHAAANARSRALGSEVRDMDEAFEAVLYADGGSRGNPGPAASAAVLVDRNGTVVRRVGRFLGVTTNNVAEWTALLLGLEAARERGVRSLAVRMDSELVVKQLEGAYKVRQPHLRPLYERAKSLLRHFDRVAVAHVPRRENAEADRLVNEILDQEASKGGA
jgi:ribonuclease HI